LSRKNSPLRTSYKKTRACNPGFFITGGEGRIRTFEGISRQIYSLMRLATSLPPRPKCILCYVPNFVKNKGSMGSSLEPAEGFERLRALNILPALAIARTRNYFALRSVTRHLICSSSLLSSRLPLLKVRWLKFKSLKLSLEPAEGFEPPTG
jgi:hypothetical protein